MSDAAAYQYAQLAASFGLDLLPQTTTNEQLYGQAYVKQEGNGNESSSGDDRTQHPTGDGAERAAKRTALGDAATTDTTTTASEKKKPGRKPITDQPTTKRKAQNRAAQRAFRERKENHVKQLEDRIAELEQTTSTQQQENSYLKQQLQRFRQDGASHRSVEASPLQQTFDPVQSRPFTFNMAAYPSPASNTRRESTNSQAHESPRDCPGLSPGVSSTGTSPQTVSETDFFNPAAMPLFDRDPLLAPREPAVLPVMMAASPELSFGNLATSADLGFFNGQQQPQKAPSEEPMLFTDKHSFAPSAMAYRGGEDSFDALDLFDDQLLFGATGDVNHSADLFNGLDDLPDVAPATDVAAQEGGVLTCPEAWSKIVSHPKFESFDLDQLCADMRSKAVCSASKTQLHAQDAESSLDLYQKRMALLDGALEAHANRSL
ncbi:hypothetical protein BCR37DRAFT_395529 [Protomyces lactucae-debilis]|uniref:BZIP domain-containing protein n=1 Tax=Protomyces lactucae-debilis TaxID=2754530 RepID=A0A1Y2EV50_PROLT|nr:uncharacterized protein BCR37DRAFT_395529 [Protomyces lactucae-debilis]ORY75429.1 hypothetical protein BCR37DRAFT_395529 [Protomyces lactucae-debilis]